VGDDYQIHAYESTFEEMGNEAVKELAFGAGTFEIEGHTHDDGSTCDGLSGVTFSIMATTFDGVEHKLLFTPTQLNSMILPMVEFMEGIAGIDASSE